MSGGPRLELIICQPFKGLLDTGERIGNCHACGRMVRRAAGQSTKAEAVRAVCMECAEFYPAPAPGTLPDPRAGEGCVCGRPVPCPCGFTCFVCGGLLQPSLAVIRSPGPQRPPGPPPAASPAP